LNSSSATSIAAGESVRGPDEFAAIRGNDFTADETAEVASKIVLCSALDMVNANFRAQV
jgi:hypothetical protein